jgi:uncharacterized repeat protein (TIGR03803 family)
MVMVRMVAAGLATAMLAVSPAAHAAHAAREMVLHSFAGGTHDGATPEGALINVAGTLYGTTSGGGAFGFGTVFSMTPAGDERVLYSFKGGATDTLGPNGALLAVGDKLHGTTGNAVFEVTTAGAERIVYTFKGNGDATLPVSGLINLGGALFGTTITGGAAGHGAIYRLAQTGGESVIHSFQGGRDGEQGFASLINVHGVLYGTTAAGGGGFCDGVPGCGTVFEVTTDGAEKIVYAFPGGTSSFSPEAPLVEFGDRLYGTATNTVFSVTRDGAEQTVYSFQGGNDGFDAVGGLIAVGNGLYGTTLFGGAHNGGTVYRLGRTGAESVVYSFGAPGDAVSPSSNLLEMGGALYGTTNRGGAHGEGAVFKIIP